MAHDKPSWLIIFRDGRYAYAWGDSAVGALNDFFDQFRDGVYDVRPASEFPSQPDPTKLIRPVTVDPASPFAGEMPALYDVETRKRKA